jgi:hypothetical protein
MQTLENYDGMELAFGEAADRYQKLRRIWSWLYRLDNKINQDVIVELSRDQQIQYSLDLLA